MKAWLCKRQKSKYPRKCCSLVSLNRMISPAATRNTILFLCLFIYYVVLLFVSRYQSDREEDEPGNSEALLVLDSFLLIFALIAVIFSWTARQLLEKSSVLITSVLFALTFCWLVVATPQAEDYAAFYALNLLVGLFMLIFDAWTFINGAKGFYKTSSQGSALQRTRPGGDGLGQLGEVNYDKIKVDKTASMDEGEMHNVVGVDGSSPPYNHASSGVASGDSSSALGELGDIAVHVKMSGAEDDVEGQQSLFIGDRDSESHPRSSTSSTRSNHDSRSSSLPLAHTGGMKSGAAGAGAGAGTGTGHGTRATVGFMRRDIDLTRKGMCDGFRINMHLMPQLHPVRGMKSIPRDLVWESFTSVKHLVDSSSCHIYTAVWGGTVPVILKLIKEERVQSAVAVAEFETEENVLSRIHHPNIVRLLGSGTQPRKFLVLELLTGGTLSHSLGVRSDMNKQQMWLKKFSMLETLKLAHSLAQALNYLHNEWSNVAHIIHRDIKPDNIGWSSDGVLKLFDFGLCSTVRRQRERTEQYRLTGNTGTLRYMAPEVVLGRSYHKSVDTYSFAIMIWQVAAGKIPFREMGKKAYFDRVVIGGHRPKLDPRWPTAFSELLIACWHEDKNARPDFSEVVSELAQLVNEEEQLQLRRNNRWWLKAADFLARAVLQVRPVLLLLAVVLLGICFGLAAQEGAHTAGTSAAALGFFAALAMYALIMSYFQAWPLVDINALNTKQQQQLKQLQLQPQPGQSTVSSAVSVDEEQGGQRGLQQQGGQGEPDLHHVRDVRNSSEKSARDREMHGGVLAFSRAGLTASNTSTAAVVPAAPAGQQPTSRGINTALKPATAAAASAADIASAPVGTAALELSPAMKKGSCDYSRGDSARGHATGGKSSSIAVAEVAFNPMNSGN